MSRMRCVAMMAFLFILSKHKKNKKKSFLIFRWIPTHYSDVNKYNRSNISIVTQCYHAIKKLYSEIVFIKMTKTKTIVNILSVVNVLRNNDKTKFPWCFRYRIFYFICHSTRTHFSILSIAAPLLNGGMRVKSVKS